MRLRVMFMTFALVAFAAPAFAQDVEVRDHRKKDKGGVKVEANPGAKEAKVTSWAPQSGRVGTVVTINGSGFKKNTKIKVGGRPVKMTAWSDASISFAIPGNYYDGVITLHHPGMGQEIPVGTFTVVVDPTIGSFSPASGPAGTRVEIIGGPFAQGDWILFNGKQLAAAEFAANRIVVVIPAGATTDYFTVSRPGANYTWQSQQKFNVVQPGPVVSGMQPTYGPPGTAVKITGTYLGGDVKVFYNNTPVQVTAYTDGSLDVVVPPGAQVSAPFIIKSRRGGAQTAQFSLTLNPSISGFRPEAGGVGTVVEISGQYFAQGDQVYLNNKACKLISFYENKLTIEIPAGGAVGAFVIKRGGKEVANSNPKAFYFYGAPTITSFTPDKGPAGTRVTIYGQQFDPSSKVYYGAQELKVYSRGGDKSLNVAVPAGATNQPFTVESLGGKAQSATAFQVITYSALTGIAPTRGPAGTRVTITGTNFSNTDAFWLGTVSLPIVERAQGSYVVQIPAGAVSGKIEWESYGNRSTSRYAFEVLQPSTITGFAPTYGTVGTQVTISGSYFSAQTAVFYGNLPCQIVKRQLPGTLVVVIPGNATGNDYLWIEEAGTRVKSAQPFSVTPQIGIASFTPASGPPGTQVTITGSNYTRGSTVSLGNVNLGVNSWTATTLVVTIPEGAKTEWFYVTDGGQKVRSSAKYTVTTPPPPTPAACTLTLSQTSGPAGSSVNVMANGCEFTGTIKVWYGKQAATVSYSSKNQLTVVIPKDATGSDYIGVESDNGSGVAVRRRTTEKFTIGVKVDAKPGQK